jgi:hypothetical protein
MDEPRATAAFSTLSLLFAAVRLEALALTAALLAAGLASLALRRASKAERTVREFVDEQGREVDVMAAGMDPPGPPDD